MDDVEKLENCPTCGHKLDRNRWYISHPGTGTPVFCASFEECMTEWFEGFNVPREILDGKLECYERAHARVTDYYKKDNHK